MAPPHTSESVIEVRNVTKRFGDKIVINGVDLDVPRGGCFGLLGPNGAGKTTMLRMIYGVTEPSAGSISVFGINIAEDARSVRQRLGVTLQENALVEPLSPEENLRIFGRYHRLSGAALETRVDEMMDFLDLRSHAGMPVKALSGGYQRRLAIAMSLMNKPELLILDEPTTGLDPAIRQALWEKIRELQRGGTTVLLTTHYMDEAERLCEQVAVFADGKIETIGAPRDLIEKHLARETLEVDCDASRENEIFPQELAPLRTRSGRRLMLYTENASDLLARAHAGLADNARPTVRPTNLEDVFLSITGTNIEEGA
ncbi:MAG: ABC transporter ATP-binding protein [Deltaproteobacteria bacterium]